MPLAIFVHPISVEISFSGQPIEHQAQDIGFGSQNSDPLPDKLVLQRGTTVKAHLTSSICPSDVAFKFIR
jgi:hypothetical protein